MHKACMGTDKSYRILMAKLQERDKFEDLSADDRKILIRVIKSKDNDCLYFLRTGQLPSLVNMLMNLQFLDQLKNT
jgi:hypothetical protein